MSLRSFINSPAGPTLKPASTTPDPVPRYAIRTAKRESLPDYLVFSHLRWDFVFQRPQHLLTRCAQLNRVFFMEEPVFDAHGTAPWLELRQKSGNLRIAVPHLPEGTAGADINGILRELTDRLVAEAGIKNFVCWYYTPMAMPFTRHLKPSAVVYDCMDELSLFQGAPPSLLDWEKQLFEEADVVFTGGKTLYEHKKACHSNIHAFPSSIDARHFGKARDLDLVEAADQKGIMGPKIGYFGVIDERMNLELLAGIAAAHPEWNLILVGPVIKVDPGTLPRASNIHYLGSKSYDELPSYIRGWDVAVMPFALNDSTRFISPTKTPEYLAAGVPVVSTSIRDVVTPYGDKGLALVADDVAGFSRAIGTHLEMNPQRAGLWLEQVDEFLADLSWDRTWKQMRDIIALAVDARPPATVPALRSARPAASQSQPSLSRAVVS